MSAFFICRCIRFHYGFTQLTIGELNQLFLQINERYLPYLLQPLETYKNDPYYLDLRHELRNIIVEFERRRQRS